MHLLPETVYRSLINKVINDYRSVTSPFYPQTLTVITLSSQVLVTPNIAPPNNEHPSKLLVTYGFSFDNLFDLFNYLLFL